MDWHRTRLLDTTFESEVVACKPQLFKAAVLPTMSGGGEAEKGALHQSDIGMTPPA